MNTIPDLVQLHDSRPGVRTLLEVEVREAAPSLIGDGEAGLTTPAAVLDFVASTATLDRYHEVIEPSGWRLEAYRRNPVFQNAHNYGDILFTLGKALVTEVRAVGDRRALCQRIQFATEVNPVARIAYGLYRGGFLNAVSVGFIPLKWEDGKGREMSASRELSVEAAAPRDLGEAAIAGQGSGRGGDTVQPRRRYLEQELLEVSAVAIPANPDALALGVKSGAVMKADLKETLELLRAIVSGLQETTERKTKENLGTRWNASLPVMELARELRRVMQKA